MKKTLLIVGSGGHGKVVHEAALLQNAVDILGFADDRNTGKHILGTISDFETGKIKADCFIVAIGNNEARKNIYLRLTHYCEPAVIIHPSAVVSSAAGIGKGTVILANAVINAEAYVGENCIINSMSLVDHETQIGNHSHISQGTMVGSNVEIGDCFLSEIGERIKSFSIK